MSQLWFGPPPHDGIGPCGLPKAKQWTKSQSWVLIFSGIKSTSQTFHLGGNVVVIFFLCVLLIFVFHWCNLNVPLQGKPGFPGIPGPKGIAGLVGRDGQPGLDGFPGPQVKKRISLRIWLSDT